MHGDYEKGEIKKDAVDASCWRLFFAYPKQESGFSLFVPIPPFEKKSRFGFLKTRFFSQVSFKRPCLVHPAVLQVVSGEALPTPEENSGIRSPDRRIRFLLMVAPALPSAGAGQPRFGANPRFGDGGCRAGGGDEGGGGRIHSAPPSAA